MKMQHMILLLVVLLSGCAHTSSKESARDDRFSEELINVQSIAARLEPVIAKQIHEQGSVGAMVGIYHGGQMKFLSFGETLKGNKTLPNENTLFEIGSLTKTMTGLLLAIAIEDGKIKEDKTLGEVKREWKNQKAGEISLVELAQHRAGLPRLPCNLKVKDLKNPYASYTEKDFIQSIKDSSFNEDCLRQEHPTKRKVYSNWGYSLLGYAVAEAQKTTYPSLLQQKITKPLEMEDTVTELKKSQKSRLAQGYDEKQSPTQLWDHGILNGQGAVLSTAKDLMNYAQAYLQPEATSFAKGIYRSRDYDWNRKSSGSLWHAGMTGGYSSLMKIYPAHDLAVFYLTNTSKELKCFIETVESQSCNP